MPLPNDPKIRCGYSRFSLPEDHPFTPACKIHDEAFEHKLISRNLADTHLLKDMLRIARARQSFKLEIQAYIFYGLARVFGKLFW